MKISEQKLRDVLEVLDQTGVLSNVILIGSWCLLFYEKVFEQFDSTIRTLDVDFYVPNVKSVREKKDTINCLKDINFDVIHDTLTSKTTFISPEGSFELEFLTKLNRGQLSCVKVGNTNIYAESLSYVEIFSSNYIEVNYYGLNVKVASPASYILQKLLINDKRKEDKREKDIESIRYLMQYIVASKKYMEELKNLFDSLPKKWKSKILDTCFRNDLILFR